jgi:plastocyanin
VQKLILIGAGIGISLIITSFALLGVMTEQNALETQDSAIHSAFTVVIVMSSSRPGCENTDCYLPTSLAIDQDDTITWVNEDRGFHTVTSGYYDASDGMFDSGQLEPSAKFSYTFSSLGEFHYYCRLHPWMEGTIIVR